MKNRLNHEETVARLGTPQVTDPTAKGYTAPQCSCCGYTEEDAKMHMDHHLCRDAGNAPWEVKNALKLPAKAAPAKEYEITGFRETKAAPKSEDEAFEPESTLEPAVDVEKELYLALKAVLVMWNAKPPKKLDEMLTWRANDEKAQAMADAAIKSYEAKGRL